MSMKKMASKDAERWVAAEMFYGTGAGTRRKLLHAELSKKFDMPGYADAFAKAYEKLDLNKYAAAAIKERKRIDRTGVMKKNFGALLRGDRRGMSNGFAATVIIIGVCRATGYDKVVLAKAVNAKHKLDHELEKYKARRRWNGKPNKTSPVTNITDL